MASTTELVSADLKSKPEEAPKTFKTMSMRERLKYVKELITVEPMIAAYIMAATVCGPALNKLEFEKGCRADFQFNDTICDAILNKKSHNYTQENLKIQKLIGNLHAWQQPLQSVTPLILVLFLGSYSDRHKVRKPFLLLPVFGEFFAVAGCILSVIYMNEWSLAVHGILQTVVPSFFGGPTMITMALFAYIADVSTLEMRTLRVGVMQIVLTVCQPVALAVSGILFEAIGYIGILSVAAGLFLFAFLYGIFCVKEPKKTEITTKKSLIVDIFDPRHALDTCKLLTKRSPGINPLFIFVVLFLIFIYSVVVNGEGSLFYLYVQKLFSWGPLQYSYFTTCNTLIHLAGTIIGVPLFTNFLKLSDQGILTITLLDKIVSNVIFALAQVPHVLYIGSIVSLITGISNIAIRSMATKIVSDDDLGKAQSLFAIIETLGPMVSSPIYNKVIYINTVETYVSAYFYFGMILCAICIPVVLWMYYKMKPSKIQEEASYTNGKGVEEYQITHM